MHFARSGSTSLSVSENADYRWLTLDDAVQSVMSLQKPWLPTLPHLSALLLCFYYIPRPSGAVELGLGGGSLQRFFRYHFPRCEFQSVEHSEAVIKAFSDWFQPANASYNIQHADAQQAIKSITPQDLVFIDLFSGAGTPNFVFTEAFYRDCLLALKPDGLLALNIVTESFLMAESVTDILRALKVNFRVLAVPGYQNKVILASQAKLPAIRYDSTLQNLANQYDLNLNAVIALK